MNQNAEQILRSAKLYSDGHNYKLLRLPAQAMTLAAGIVAEASLPFSALIVDKDEVSMMLPQDVCEEFEKRLRMAEVSELDYRLVTIDVVLAPDLVGFLALVSASLAKAGIPLLSFAAYSRDHFFVPAPQIDAALEALKSLQVSATAKG